jgi:hypothetical protein
VHGLAVGYGAVWVVRDRLVRIDPGGRPTVEVPGKRVCAKTALGLALRRAGRDPYTTMSPALVTLGYLSNV